MANRVVLDLAGARVSKPGVNVLTAAPADLLFSSNWSHLREVLTGITRVTYGAAKITVPFGTTFSSIPYVDIWFKQQNGSAYGRYFVTTNPAQLGAGYLALLTTSNLQFQWSSYPQSGISYWDIAYRVWGYPTP